MTNNFIQFIFWCTLHFIFIGLTPNESLAQSVQYPPNAKAVKFMQALDVIDSNETHIHTGLRNYFRRDVLDFLSSDDKVSVDPGVRKAYLIKDNPYFLPDAALNKKGKGIIKGLFYKNRSQFFQLETPHFSLSINPILNIQLGKEQQRVGIRFQNTRGIELYGTIDKKVYFYSNVLETQGNFHNYLEDRIRKYKAIPGFSFFKPFTSSLNENITGHDFANAQAYVGVPISKHINIELGHGKHFIGHGYHSLILEDYSNNYFYVKLNTRVWKFHYQNLYTELAPISTRLNPMDNLLPKKYMTAHYLSFKPIKSMEIGLFEAVIFSRPDKFEFHYLNPVILYRTVEYYLDSPDNVILGLNGKWNLFNTFSIYGQFIVDDIKFSEIRNDDGWYGNKYGFQAGVYLPDALKIKNLNVRLEYNYVRPYTYSHRDTLLDFDQYSIANYSNYNQPLAHPLGANFREVLTVIDFYPFKNLSVELKLSHARQGRTTGPINYGDNILLPDGTRPGDYGITFLQGQKTSINSLSLNLSYSLMHNYYIDVNYLKRTEKGAKTLNTDYWGIGIRANIESFRLDY